MTTALKIIVNSLKKYDNKWIGTPAVCHFKSDNLNFENLLNYDQIFIRDFVPVALLFLIKNTLPPKREESQEIEINGKEIVYNFLNVTLKMHQEARQKKFNSLVLMPASFKVHSEGELQYLEPDFGDRAIARVTPVDSSLWWIILLRAYCQAVGNNSLAHREDFQECIRLILALYFVDRLDMEPTLLVPDGACMIDRRMGIYGYPLEIQVLFYAALRSAWELLPDIKTNQTIRQTIKNRLHTLKQHLQEHYWLDFKRLNDIYRFKVEQYGKDVNNKFNLYSDSIPYTWLSEWLGENCGYLAGNIGPFQLDCRFFTLGNLMAIISGLTTRWQAHQLMNLIQHQWHKLIAQMPIKICYPALTGRDWEIITGCDPKNKQWSYHNGGSWPVLIWFLAAATLKLEREDIIQKLKVDLIKIGDRLAGEDWPEYYDGEDGNLIGKEARKYQTWSIAGFLLAQELLENPQYLALIDFAFDGDN